MADLPIRILLVLALVTWSPAWCCCALQAAVAGEAGQGFCEGRWASASGERAANQGLPPCCLARTISDAHLSESEHRAIGCCDDDDSSCNCGDRPDELTRLDTAGKVTMPPLDRNMLAVVGVHAYEHETSQRHSAWLRWRSGPPEGSPRTLFGQRCLLLT